MKFIQRDSGSSITEGIVLGGSQKILKQCTPKLDGQFKALIKKLLRWPTG